MKTPADILYSLLGYQSLLGSFTGFVGFLPDLPDSALCIYDTNGVSDGRILATGERIEHPGFQIRVRAADYTEAYTKANTLALALDAVRNIELEESDSTYTIRNITRTTPVLALGMEEADGRRCFHFAINGIATIAQQ